ncbi:hypothetical protein VINE108521_16390 [Vibrio neonatus]
MSQKTPQKPNRPHSHQSNPTNADDRVKGGYNPTRYERRPIPPVKPPAKSGNK